MPRVKISSRRSVQRFDDYLFVFEDAKKRNNEDFKTRQIAPPRYVD
jgi:hypothetical protein